MPKPSPRSLKVRASEPGRVEFSRNFDPVDALIARDPQGDQASIILEVPGPLDGSALFLTQRRTGGDGGVRSAAVSYFDGLTNRVFIVVDDDGNAQLTVVVDGETKSISLDGLESLVRSLDELEAIKIQATASHVVSANEGEPALAQLTT